MLKRAVLIGLVLGIVLFLFTNLFVCNYDFRGTWVRECNETTNGTWIIEKHLRILTCFGRTWLFEDLSLRKTEFAPKCRMPKDIEAKLGWLTVRATTWWGKEPALVPVCDYTVVILDPSGQERTYRPIPGTNIAEIPIREKGEHIVSYLAAGRYRVCEYAVDLDPAKASVLGCSSNTWLAPWPEEGK